jgi:Protein of unknown function (DUF1761)
MLLLFWVLLFLTAVCLMLLMPAIWGKHIYNTYRDSRSVNCPETHMPVNVWINAFRAAITGLSGKPKLTLADCTRWPERAGCDQACLADAERATPQMQPRDFVPAANRIAHLPALLAAGVAWVLGMAWHSEYMFRSQWAKSVGLTDQQAHDLARTLMPHLVTVGICLLFSYGVAMLLARLGKRTIWTGIWIAIAAWVIVVAGLLLASPMKPAPPFRWIEGGYTLLAALLTGLIVGGVPLTIFPDGESGQPAAQSRRAA